MAEISDELVKRLSGYNITIKLYPAISRNLQKLRDEGKVINIKHGYWVINKK